MKSRHNSTIWLQALLILCLAAIPATAQDSDSADQDAEAKRQARVEAYLQKKEQKKVEKEQRKAEKALAREAELAAQAEAQAAEEAAALEKSQAEEAARLQREHQETAEKAIKHEEHGKFDLPKDLQEAQDNVRRSKLGDDPSVQAYLELVDRQEASPYQLAAMGNFLANAGMRNEAMEYYQVALRLEQNDPLLWMNIGTLHRQRNEKKAAAEAYVKALSIDRNYAAAHYNLGATLDAMGKYEEAVQEYKIALQLDPSLGDPTVNPQAANNERMMTVQMLLYRESTGSAGMPLADVPQGDLPEGSAGND